MIRNGIPFFLFFMRERERERERERKYAMVCLKAIFVDKIGTSSYFIMKPAYFRFHSI